MNGKKKFWLIICTVIILAVAVFLKKMDLDPISISVISLILFIISLFLVDVDISKLTFGKFQLWLREADKNLHTLYKFFAKATLHVYTKELISGRDIEAFNFQRSLIKELEKIKLSKDEIDDINNEWYQQGRKVLINKIIEYNRSLFAGRQLPGGGTLNTQQVEEYTDFIKRLEHESLGARSYAKLKKFIDTELNDLVILGKFDHFPQSVRPHVEKWSEALKTYLEALHEFETNHWLSHNTIERLQLFQQA